MPGDSGTTRSGPRSDGGLPRRSVSDDCDFTTQTVGRYQRKTVAAPKPARVKPIRPLLGFDQAHLLVGDCHCLGAVSGFEAALALLLPAASGRFANARVQPRDSAHPVVPGRKLTAQPPQGEA